MSNLSPSEWSAAVDNSADSVSSIEWAPGGGGLLERARSRRRRGRWSFTAIMAAVLAGPAAAAPPNNSSKPAITSPDPDDPCDGLFALMDRPTVADSSCAVKPGRLLTELGYQNGTIKGSDTSRLAVYPQAALRYGLPEGWELRLFPPTYATTDVRAAVGGGHVDGLGDTAFGAKYQVGTFGGFTVATDAKVTVPSGRDDFSGEGVQGNVQGMVSYNLTPKLGVLVQLGASSLTNRTDSGQAVRYGSLSANFVVGYQINDRINLFSEIFGNSMSAPDQIANLSYIGGVQFLLTESIELDVEAGTLLSGPQGQQARFFGVGAGLLF